MSIEDVKHEFMAVADTWVCDGYFLDIRYIAFATTEIIEVWDAAITINPLPAAQNLSFGIERAGVVTGHIQSAARGKIELLQLITDATAGELELSGKRLILPADRAYDFYSEMGHREQWYSQLHLCVSGNRRPVQLATDLSKIDSALRLASTPFDGLSDVTAWLGLSDPRRSGDYPTINIRVGPPVDLIIGLSSLADNNLRLLLHAHPLFDVKRVGLSMRVVPGSGQDARRQIADEISWGDIVDGRREGKIDIRVQHADNVLVMLMIGTSTVRRQWFVDPIKARNYRLLATQHFDKDLRMLRQAVLEASDSRKLEQGVALLLFLLGFSPAIQLENDAPDLIVSTPGGRLVVIECTTRISDFSSKVGKLVDRRGSLSKSLSASGHLSNVSAALVCASPRDQIAAHANEPSMHDIILIAREELEAIFERLRFPSDPDKMLDEAVQRVSGKQKLGID